MGRVLAVRSRVLLTVVLAAVIPLSVVATSRMTLASGAPAISLTVALVVAHLLSVGPRGAPLAWAAFALHGMVVADNAPTLGLAVVAAVQALAAVACVRLLEARFAHHGPVRTVLVNVDHALISAAALPLLVVGAGTVLPPLVGLEPWPGPVLQQALAEGIGVLAVTAGMRMLVMGELLRLRASAVVRIVAACAVSVSTVLVTLQIGGIEVLASSQVVLLPVLVVALLVGTAAYAIAIGLTTVGVVVPIAIAGTGGGWPVDTPAQVVWWIVGFAGLLLATEGDRRRAAAAEFRTFFMHSATPTLSVSTVDGTVTRANEAVAELLGSRADDLVGRSLFDLVDHEPGVVARLERVMAGESGEFVSEFALRPRPGRQLWLRCIGVRVDLGGPQQDAVQVQFIDLTSEREREGSLQRSNEALERFGRRVSHDLKQPLSAVAGYASTLAEHGDRMNPSDVRTMHTRLESVARRATAQLDETFMASRVRQAARTRVDLHDIVAAVVGVVDIDLAEGGGSVDTVLSVTRLQADPSMLRQVLLNLVTNSAKYADDGTSVRIRIVSRVRSGGVEITVTDNGTGIPAEQLEAVFERGRRLDPERADGRGHGLADSRELAEAAGGWLVAEPRPDGARFVLWLPDPGVAGAEPKTRVLVVHDEDDELTALINRLELQPSIEVVGTATTLEAAAAATRDLQPDVVLLDPWVDDVVGGPQAAVEFARAHPDVRIVLLTGDDAPDLRPRARAGGALRTLDKAASDDDLAAEVVGGTAR